MTLVIPATLSVLVSVWMETLCYGINVVIYSICLYVFLFSLEGRRRGILLVSTLLFAAATAHVAVNLRRLIEGYVLPPTKADMLNYLIDANVPTDIAKYYLIVIIVLLSDLLITWRVHVVWGYNWRITTIPLFLCLSVFGTGLASFTSEAVSKPGSSIFQTGTLSLGTAMMVLSFAMNMTSTFLIASRIWWVTRETLPLGSHGSDSGSSGSRRQWKQRYPQYWRLIILIVESASLGAFVQILLLGFYTARFPAIYLMIDTSVQIAAMSPLLIIAFVGLTVNGSQSTSDWSNFTSYHSFADSARAPVVRRPRDDTSGGTGRGREGTQRSDVELRSRSFESKSMPNLESETLGSPVTSMEKGKQRDMNI